MNDQTMTDADWELYRKGYRAVQRMDARASLRNFYRRHLGCSFEIAGRTMSGRKVTDQISGASDDRLRAFHHAATLASKGFRRESVLRCRPWRSVTSSPPLYGPIISRRPAPY